MSKQHSMKEKCEKNISQETIKNLSFPYYEQPIVSIVIPAYNKLQYTVNCLKSISENTASDYEVIVVDDASQDETATILSRVKNLRLINNKKNMGFVESCNLGAKAAKGNYILFLNNDTMMTKDWLPPLLEVITRDDVGAVGSKLLYPDGTLQEAGAILWSNGIAFNYGRGDDPGKAEYNYVREVDYCTGACLLVKKELFDKVDGFDKRFKPMYCEESDFCLRLKNLGYKVMYQPASVVVHFEGVTIGDSSRKYQEINVQKLKQKWNVVLQKYHKSPDSANLFLARDRGEGPRMLFIDRWVPTYDQDAGALTTYNYLRLFLEMGFRITFIPDDRLKLMPYTVKLQQLGIEVLYGNFDFAGWIKECGKYIDLVWLTRPETSIKYIDRIRERSGAKVIYYTMDLHYLRAQRRYELEKDPDALEHALRCKYLEFKIFGKVDAVLTPSNIEKDIISREFPGQYTEVIPALIFFEDLTHKVIPFDARKDLLFVGGFLHAPNVDAVIFLVNEIFPLIKEKLPNVWLYIVGSNPPQQVLGLKRSDIRVTGYVKDLSPYIEKCRLFVAPLRYGAGVKGKILISMSHGLPVVTTTIGAEGMTLIDGENVLIADDPQEFAKKAVSLYNDDALWGTLSKNSIKYCNEYFSYGKAKMKLEEVIGALLQGKYLNFGNPMPVANKRQTVPNMREREARIGDLEDSVTEKEARIGDFDSALREKEVEVERLKTGQAEKEREIESLKEIISQKDTLILQKEASLNHIYNSRGWKTLMVYYRMRDKVLSIYTKWTVTAPLRKIAGWLRRVAVGFANTQRSPSPAALIRRREGHLNVLYFSPIPSHPSNHGNQATIQQFGRFFQRFGHKVHFALLQSYFFSQDDVEDMRVCWDTFDILPNSHPLEADGNPIPFDGWYEEGLGERIGYLCKKYDVDVIFCSYVFQSKLLEFVPAHILKVIDTHDKMGNRYEMLRANGESIMEFFSCTPEEEGAYLRRADIVVARREEEARYFDSVTGRNTAIVIPYVEDPHFLVKTFSGLRNIGMVASPNRINLAITRAFLDAIDSHLQGRDCPFTVHIAGQLKEMVLGQPNCAASIWRKPWVRMHGFVPDIVKFYDDMDLIVSPATIGTGINVKTVQAMAFGMPLVTTACASKGIETGDPMHSHIYMDALVITIFSLINRPNELQRLAAVSRARYTTFYQSSLATMREIFAHPKLVAM